MKILHLEDSSSDADLIDAVLRRELVPCDVERVATREAFLGALGQTDWDIILADYSMPSFDGMAALQLAATKQPDVPFIFVTGALGEELAVETLKTGATDYILKSRLHRLPQAVIRAKRERASAKARTEAERKLQALLRDKELLLQEVHHRVKNNLQIICSLLNMQCEAINDPLLAAALHESQRRIQSMATIHEMLYASNSMNNIDFGEYTHLLCGEVSNSYGVDAARIHITYNVEPIDLTIDFAIPCGLILNELLSNAFKYAFPNARNGEVVVSLQKEGRSIRLSIADNGIGFEAGASSVAVQSIGLRIVDILARQLGGNMEVTSNQQGSQFVLKFAPSDHPIG